MQRDFDPQIGRYIESGPIGLFGGSFSTYSYTGSSPIRNIDPTGENAIAIGAGVGTAIEPGGGTAIGAAIGGIITGAIIIYEVCKDKACPPCTPYAEGAIGYLGPHADNHFNKSLGRYLNPHLNLFEVNQNKADCKCRWNKSKLDSAEPPPLPGWVDLNNGFPALSP